MSYTPSIKWTKAKLLSSVISLSEKLDIAEMDLDETREVTGSQLSEAQTEIKRLNEQIKGERDYAKRTLDTKRAELMQGNVECKADLSKSRHEVWLLRDLLVTLYNDRK